MLPMVLLLILCVKDVIHSKIKKYTYFFLSFAYCLGIFLLAQYKTTESSNYVFKFPFSLCGFFECRLNNVISNKGLTKHYDDYYFRIENGKGFFIQANTIKKKVNPQFDIHTFFAYDIGTEK